MASESNAMDEVELTENTTPESKPVEFGPQPEHLAQPAEPIDPNKTLAEQISQNENEMYHRTQQYIQEIEEEVS
jgi:hypothetical protein